MSNNVPIVSTSDFIRCRNYDVAYYSGHGGWKWNNDTQTNNPCLNAQSSSSLEINVATALCVAGNDWQTTCIVRPTNSLRVFLLASCFQLNDNNSKYYARMMKASGVRVVAGYHDVAPSDGDDTIASSFVARCEVGDSVKTAWSGANSGKNWAVLVFSSNGNENYRLPGFPGATYSAPASSSAIWRFKITTSNYSNVVLGSVPGIDTVTDSVIRTHPLSITMTTSQSSETFPDFSREAVWDTAVADSKSTIERLFATALKEEVSNKPYVQYQVSREEVDTESGIVPETEIVVEHTYKYFDTYNGVKIADSFVSASIDSEGINNITVSRKTVTSGNGSAMTVSGLAETNTNLVSQANALKLLLVDHACIANSEFLGASLAYVPDGSGNHVLCYEFAFASGFYYVNVATGDIVDF